jgi:hypothetical protein
LKKSRFVAEEAPRWEDVKGVGKLDFVVQAIGYDGKLGKEMEWFHREVTAVTDNHRQKQSHDSEDQNDQDGEDQENESEDKDSEEDEAEQEESDKVQGAR